MGTVTSYALFSNELKPRMSLIVYVDIPQGGVKHSRILAVRHRAKGTSIRDTKIAKLLLIVAFFLGMFPPSVLAWTTIAVYRDRTTVIVAADSKIGAFNGYRERVVCKIYRTGNLFWSLTGLSADYYETLVSEASAKSHSFRGTVEGFESIAPPAMRDGFIKLKITSPLDYKAFMEGKNPGSIDFAFFGMEGKIPFIAIVGFRAVEIQGVIGVSKVGDLFYEEPACPDGKSVCGNAIGNFKAILGYQSANPTWSTDLVSGVRKFVQLEIDAVPDAVGPPIRILKIDSKGPRWIQNGEGCDIGVPSKANNLLRKFVQSTLSSDLTRR
jgi:hypothetical protein